MTTKTEEYQRYIKFYKIFSSQLPEVQLAADAIENTAKDLVFNPKNMLSMVMYFQLFPN